jgi:hypothetical protein
MDEQDGQDELKQRGGFFSLCSPVASVVHLLLSQRLLAVKAKILRKD